MDFGLKGKRAIVTGGTRGIGRAIADTLADEGCDVAVCARTESGVIETVEALKAKGVNATGKALDVADGQTLRDRTNMLYRIILSLKPPRGNR